MDFHAQDMFPQCMALSEFGGKFVSQFEDKMGKVYYNWQNSVFYSLK